MTSLHAIELNWIVTIQGDAALRQLMIWFSCLGAEAIPCVLALIYFCVSQEMGARLYLLLAFSTCVEESSKIAFHSPRPYWMDSRVKSLARAPTYGLPSGHVLTAAVVWPFAAKILKERWVWGIALSVVLLVSASRVYLGVHFISDVVAAWLFAALLLWSFSQMESKLSSRLDSMNSWYQAAAGFWGAAALIALGMGVHWTIEGMADPPIWAAASHRARDLTRLIYTAGSFFGAVCGITMAVRWARFHAAAVWWNGAVCVTYAMAGTWLIRELLGAIPAPRDEALRWVLEFSKGAILNWWMLFLAPWILLKTIVLKNRATSLMMPLNRGVPRGTYAR